MTTSERIQKDAAFWKCVKEMRHAFRYSGAVGVALHKASGNRHPYHRGTTRVTIHSALGSGSLHTEVQSCTTERFDKYYEVVYTPEEITTLLDDV